jgi:hypothetical protein
MKKGYVYTPKNQTKFFRECAKIESFLTLIDNRVIRALLVADKSIHIGMWEVHIPNAGYYPVTLIMTDVGLCVDFCIFLPVHQSVTDINGVSFTLAECGYVQKTLMIQFLKDLKKITGDKIANLCREAIKKILK